MGTKINPGAFDCYHAAKPDEPMFVLLARDPLAPGLVRQWADHREKFASNDRSLAKAAEARRCADAMERWQSDRGVAVLTPTAGRVYRRVDLAITGKLRPTGLKAFPLIDPDHHILYRADGRYRYDGAPDRRDLTHDMETGRKC